MSYFPETETINILDIFEKCGEEALLTCLSSFSCPKNMEVENFLKEKALDFARKKLSITYLLMDNNDATLLGYFTLAIRQSKFLITLHFQIQLSENCLYMLMY